ncbi:hypothetical protein A3724_14935 [Alcanivorax sp. HI0033]|jgi:hypothetical protein|uniref:hypothetical protein n=1 Tax=unclassified Alcanivorax TaxID=2638842 RepID=UPI0007B7FA6C|nr:MULTISPECIES: hypothetical protein [unclassified Alcanivorax]KZX74042.1 hypothetical protein A3716_12900 [Alcanivorax sp. HI0011]KZX78103.1 hypothetical protein A3717_11530 [Alcanivorax sp. HI0013]KZY14102.1 hypothetical protein A3725_01535 [Alcanivorax sp. HI0035]KZX61281.1 hypothetical protein A3713_09930 [Alcanivorax sp. HI0003]KZX66927.1 hypothetical protein A3714_12395 [Alcanivorax sp. HI0007]
MRDFAFFLSIALASFFVPVALMDIGENFTKADVFVSCKEDGRFELGSGVSITCRVELAQ